MFDPGWKRWSVSVLSYLQLSSRYNRPAVSMSTCLSLVHGYIFLLYVYLFNKDVCWEICHGFIYIIRFKDISQNVTTSTISGCGWLYFFYCFCHLAFCLMFVLIYQSSIHFFKVCCTGWTLEIYICVNLNFKFLKELGNGLTHVCIFWFSFLFHSLIP